MDDAKTEDVARGDVAQIIAARRLWAENKPLGEIANAVSAPIPALQRWLYGDMQLVEVES